MTEPGRGRAADAAFLRGLGRAAGGAIIFALPLLMTMEMWHLGFYVDRLRLALLLVVVVPLLVGLSHYIGFEETFGWRDDLVDAFVALAVGALASAAVLALLGVLRAGMSLDELVGKVALQAVPASVGALLAQSQLGTAQGPRARARRPTRYAGELFFMAVGALFLSLNLAVTEEIVIIAYRLTDRHVLALVAVSLGLMHAFVYAVEFRGQAAVPTGTPWWSPFLRFTVAGYAIVLLIGAYTLWTVGRLDGLAPEQALRAVLVLGFPGAVGAAAARLIL
ncbi:MAG TPA: TIGR02587 family membrane protein [Gemmatimonadales bacterium]|nr:TIGR02587 family membrane protein [Gemmatimonadales bacterium]